MRPATGWSRSTSMSRRTCGSANTWQAPHPDERPRCREAPGPLVERRSAKGRGQPRVGVAVRQPIGVGGEARVVEGRVAERLDQRSPELVGMGDDHHRPAVGRLEHVVGHDLVVLVAEAPGRLAGGEEVSLARDGAEQRGVEHREVDPLTPAGPLSLAERGERTPMVANIGVMRSANGKPVRRGPVASLPVRVHQPGHGLDHRIEGRPLAIRPLPPEPGDGAVDEAGVDRTERLVPHAETLGRAGGSSRRPRRPRPPARGPSRVPPGVLRSSTALRLFRLRLRTYSVSPPTNVSPVRRMASPSGGSILMTSAPRSPSSMVQSGPAIICVKSATRMSRSGPSPAAGRPGGRWCRA